MASGKNGTVNNEIYDHYGERWYSAKDDPVALLRAEARARNRWIVSELAGRFPGRRLRILDVGCGAGFLCNELARHGHSVTGIDASRSSLEVARRHDPTATVNYLPGDAYTLEFTKGEFDVVCALDFLEHVESPELVVREAARVLREGGLFFFHTFSRNLLSWLIVIKGVEWFVRNTPRGMHRLRYFIKPRDLRLMCSGNGIEVVTCRGLVPKLFSRAFWKMIVTGTVDDDFDFVFARYTLLGYLGAGIRIAP